MYEGKVATGSYWSRVRDADWLHRLFPMRCREHIVAKLFDWLIHYLAVTIAYHSN